MSSVYVIILKCETRECDDNITNLTNLFKDDFFSVTILNTKDVNESAYEPFKYKMTFEAFIENNQYYQAFLDAQKNACDMPCIIIKDSSITHISSSVLMMHIKNALKIKNIEICFMNQWQDECHDYKDTNYPNIKWTRSSFATQAVLYRPKARKMLMDVLKLNKLPLPMILKHHVKNELLTSAVFFPTLFHFDINLATSNDDYTKLNVCAPIINETTPSENYYYVWLGFIIITIIVLAICIPYLSDL